MKKYKSNIITLGVLLVVGIVAYSLNTSIKNSNQELIQQIEETKEEINSKNKDIEKLNEDIKDLEDNINEIKESVDDISLKKEEIKKIAYTSGNLLSNEIYNFFSFMDYRAITNKSSPQWHYRVNGWTRSDGVRMYDDCIQVAVGTPYASVGDKLVITTDNGEYLAIVGDSKGNRTSHGDSTIEILVDDGMVEKQVWVHGNLNYLFGNNVMKIEKLT